MSAFPKKTLDMQRAVPLRLVECQAERATGGPTQGATLRRTGAPETRLALDKRDEALALAPIPLCREAVEIAVHKNLPFWGEVDERSSPVCWFGPPLCKSLLAERFQPPQRGRRWDRSRYTQIAGGQLAFFKQGQVEV